MMQERKRNSRLKHSALASHEGQALHEYAIAIALIAIVGIGGLKLLGFDFSNLIGSVSNTKTQNDVQQLYSLVGADVHGGATTTTGTSGGTTTVSLKINPKTGLVEVLNTTGGATNVTSIDGSNLIANVSMELALLSNTRTSSNQPLPDNIQQLLKQLSTYGTQLSANYSTIVSLKPSFDKTNAAYAVALAKGAPTPNYNPKIVQATVSDTNTYLNFATTYQQLQQELTTLAKTDPAMAALQTQVADYSGSISGLTYSNVAVPTFSQFHINAVDPITLMSSLSKAPLANQYFTQAATAAAKLPPSQQEQFFQQSFVNGAQQTQVGTPIDAATGLSIAINPTPAANNNGNSNVAAAP